MSSISATIFPTNAQCRSMLADGRLLTVTASRRPRSNRADVKCVVAGASALCERMQEVVRLARHTEPRFDSRDQVVLSMDIAPAAGERDWELAAVLADRMVRGVFQPPHAEDPGALLCAQGWSDAWHLGQLRACAPLAIDGQRQPLRDGMLILADDGGAASDALRGQPGVLHIRHLGALTGHADPASAVSRARCWFPLHSGGGNDSLGWVEVSVYPIDAGGDDEELSISAPGLELSVQQGVRRTLAEARHFDGKGLGRWRSVVRFDQPRFQGDSYQLALVMADRLARGREFVPRGRIIASGCSSAWHAGRVETVQGREAKLELIFSQVRDGDRVLLPLDWQTALPAAYVTALRARGASLACIDRIGMI